MEGETWGESRVSLRAQIRFASLVRHRPGRRLKMHDLARKARGVDNFSVWYIYAPLYDTTTTL